MLAPAAHHISPTNTLRSSPSAVSKSSRTTSPGSKFKLSRFTQVSKFQILSALVLLLVLAAQFLFHDNAPSDLTFNEDPYLSPFGESVYRQEAYFDQLEPGTECKPKNVFSSEQPYSKAPTNMALVEEVKRMVAEFEYGPEEMNKGVKEFIRQMNEGLGKQGSTMSQIPSYVTAVPNGTEKVAHTRTLPEMSTDNHKRASTWRSTLEGPISAFAVSS